MTDKKAQEFNFDSLNKKDFEYTVKDSLTDSSITAVYYPFEKEKDYIKCPNCAEAAEVNTDIVCTSMPPKYHWVCAHCGKDGYIYCHDLSNLRYRPKLAEKTSPDVKLHDYTECIICGETIPVSFNESRTKVCEHCKDAVISVRKLLGTWHD